MDIYIYTHIYIYIYPGEIYDGKYIHMLASMSLEWNLHVSLELYMAQPLQPKPQRLRAVNYPCNHKSRDT